MQIEALIDSDLAKRLAKSRELGRAKRIDDAHGALYRIRQAHAAAQLSLDGLRIVIDCAHGAAYKVAPKRCGSWAPKSSPSASSRTASTSTATAARPRPKRLRARCAKCAPISASRSTATPTAS